MTGIDRDARIVEIDGFRLAIDAMDSLGLGLGLPFEPEVLSALQRCVRPGDKVVDIGANVGYFSAHLARLVGPHGEVHAFEPEPQNCALLVANMRTNGLSQVHVHPVALGERQGTATLHISEFNGGMHRLYDSVCCTGPGLAVPVQRLDDVMAGARVDLIKIDVEGYEPAVLKGAASCLRTHPDIRVVSEYCPASMLEAGGLPSEMLQFLGSMGLLPHQLDGSAIALEALLDDARRYEAYGAVRLGAACAGKSNPEILAVVSGLSASLGCRRPVLENLLFAR